MYVIGLCVLHTALVLFVFFGSLYIQVIKGFIHDDHGDLINKYVIRETKDFLLYKSLAKLTRIIQALSVSDSLRLEAIDREWNITTGLFGLWRN